MGSILGLVPLYLGPLFLVLGANYVREAINLTTSTGADIVLTLLGLDIALVFDPNLGASLDLTRNEGVALIVLLGIAGGFLFLWALRVQVDVEEADRTEWFNSKTSHIKLRLGYVQTRSNFDYLGVGTGVIGLLAIHLNILAR